MSVLQARGFSTSKYLRAESAALAERVKFFGGRLYLEVGGKFYNDGHASRVLPGYDPDAKVRLLKRFKGNIRVVHCISSLMLRQGKFRGDTRVLYSDQLVEDMRVLRKKGMPAGAVFISRVSGRTKRAADAMRRKLARAFGKGGPRIILGYEIADYPRNLRAILSDGGYGRQEHLSADSGLTVVTAPGPGSGKMAFCMAQMYGDRLRGINSGYAKVETFPVRNLPLNHPVNVAYEAATADIGDYNVLDARHKAVYGVTAVNYNRDIANFSIMKRITQAMTAEDDPLRRYRSATDIVISCTKAGIIDDDIVRQSAEVEILRRYWQARRDRAAGHIGGAVVRRMERILRKI